MSAGQSGSYGSYMAGAVFVATCTMLHSLCRCLELTPLSAIFGRYSTLLLLPAPAAWGYLLWRNFKQVDEAAFACWISGVAFCPARWHLCCLVRLPASCHHGSRLTSASCLLLHPLHSKLCTFA